MRVFVLGLVLLAGANAADIQLRTLTAQMKYNESEFQVKPGERINLTFENGDDLPHNFVLCRPGTDVLALSLRQMDKPEEALKNNWLPKDPSVLAHSKMLNPHERQSFSFTMPDKPGTYPFVCTFPGHAMTMNGKFQCFPQGPQLSELRFKLYLGSWKKLPDFSKLAVHREGAIADNLIDLKFDDYKNEYAVVFEGKLKVERKGSFRFFLAGDDGVRLLIDGKKLIEHDGIHPSGSIREGALQLEAGEHAFRLEYFQAAGEAEVFAAWKGSQFAITPLSRFLPKGWEFGATSKRREFDPIVLEPKVGPVLYRNFIADAGNRAIGLGLPGGINLAWSAESMDLALLWRGAFMDAGRHWNSRGGGHQPPLGYDVIKPLGAPPQASEQRRYLGYRLDAQGNPTLRWAWGEAEVAETYQAQEGGLLRRLQIKGALPKDAALELLRGASAQAKGPDLFVVSSKPVGWQLRCVGARLSGGALHLPLHEGEQTILYQWNP